MRTDKCSAVPCIMFQFAQSYSQLLTLRLWRDVGLNERKILWHSTVQKSYMLVMRSCRLPQRPEANKSAWPAWMKFVVASYHVEPLISKLPRLISGCAIYPCTLLILLRCSLDFCYSFFELFMHSTIKYWMPNVVTKVERANKEDIDARYFCNCIDLRAQPSISIPQTVLRHQSTNILQRLLRFDLHNCQQALICLL